MANNPSISVIVPVYKVEQYIKICVDSILAQTFQDFEVILVDDASPDRSFEVCQKLYGNNDKVKLVRHKKNMGQGPARNTGMKNAHGKYICFVDSDDLILPKTFERLYATAEKNNAQVVHVSGWFELWQEEIEPILQKNIQRRADRSQEGMLSSNMVQRVDKAWREYTLWSMPVLSFCRRDFLEKNRIEFLPILSEDETFSFAVLYYVERCYVLQDAFYIYRRRRNSIMTTRTVEHFLKGLNSAFVGSAYIKKFLDRTPRFDGYDQWCDGIMTMAFLRYTANFLLAHYNNLTVPPEINKVVKAEFKKKFHEYEPFVRYLFHYYHIYYYQTRGLIQQNQKLQQQTKEILSQVDSIFKRAPVAENKIVFVDSSGGGYSGDFKQITEELLRQNLSCDLVWAIKNLDAPLPEKIRKVKFDSLDTAYEIATAKVVVTSTDGKLPFNGKKDGQFYITEPFDREAATKIQAAIKGELIPAALPTEPALEDFGKLMTNPTFKDNIDWLTKFLLKDIATSKA